MKRLLETSILFICTSTLAQPGLGQTRASIAERLLAPDVDLYVFDTRQEAMEPFAKGGATACASPALQRTTRRSSSPACPTRR